MNGNRSNVIAAISYLTWIGFLIALCVRDRRDDYVAFHLNQALLINLLEMVGGILTVVPLIGGMASSVVSLAVGVLWIIGIYRAATWNAEPLPIIGDIHLIG